MFSFTRIVRFKNVGSMLSAMPVCVQIVEHFKKVHKMDAHLMTPMLGGHPARALFVFRSDSLATVQDVLAKSAQDKEYIALVVKLGEFVDGSATNDQTWQVVA
jgi:hypothetical protein